MSLPPIETFSGTHYEMGFQQGKAYKQNLFDGIQTVQKQPEFLMLKPNWLPKGFFFTIAKNKAIGYAKPIIEKYAPNQAERVRGIADGSGLDEKWLYMLLSTEMIFNTPDLKVPAMPASCSDIGILSSMYEGNEPIIARNFDYNTFVVPYLRVRQNKPKEGFGSLDITASPLPGTFNGINEHGVFIGTNYCFTTDEQEPGLPPSILIQEALEKCQTTQEVIDFLRKSQRGTTNNWLVADAQNDFRRVEYTSNHIFDIPAEQNFIVVTNHYLSPELQKINFPKEAVLGDKNPPEMRGIVYNETSWIRLGIATEKLKSIDVVSIDFLQSLLCDHSTDPEAKYNALCHHDKYSCSAASMIMELQSKNCWICFGSPCQHEYTQIKYTP